MWLRIVISTISLILRANWGTVGKGRSTKSCWGCGCALSSLPSLSSFGPTGAQLARVAQQNLAGDVAAHCHLYHLSHPSGQLGHSWQGSLNKILLGMWLRIVISTISLILRANW